MLADLAPSDDDIRQGNEEADSMRARKQDYPMEHGVKTNNNPMMVLYKCSEAFRHRHSAQSQLSIQPAHKHQCLPSPKPGFADPYPGLEKIYRAAPGRVVKSGLNQDRK